MEILINGQKADIRPDTEKTVGEILCALDNWLADSGHRLSGLCIDGETTSIADMESCFNREIDSISLLDIHTSALTTLIAESLVYLLQDIASYEAADHAEKSPFAANWIKSPGACLLAEQSPELFHWAVQAFSGEGTGTYPLRMHTEELIRELQDPLGEMGKAEPLVSEVCSRLEEFPLDIQTGKDVRAAETVNIFSGIVEKIFRVFNVLKLGGFPVGEIMVEKTPIETYISEFNTALLELIAAYEQKDTVLVGDLAEYEMAPRLRSLHSAVLNGIIY